MTDQGGTGERVRKILAGLEDGQWATLRSIQARVNAERPEASRSTVYRELRKMEEQGIAQRRTSHGHSGRHVWRLRRDRQPS